VEVDLLEEDQQDYCLMQAVILVEVEEVLQEEVLFPVEEHFQVGVVEAV
jgi:hypothetical protein